MRKYLVAALFAVMLAVPNLAHAICSTATITTSSTQLVAANFAAGGTGRGPLLYLVGGTSCPVYCDLDVTAATIYSGTLVPTAATVPILPTEHVGKTNPIVPSGAVYCIVPADMGCSSQSVSVCSF
jgi:hypothetical protein